MSDVEIKLQAINSDKEALVWTRQHTWWSWPFALLGYQGPWREWGLLNNRKYQLIEEKNNLCRMIEEVDSEIKEEEAFIKTNLELVKKCAHNIRGWTNAFYISREQLPMYGRLPIPDNYWKKIIRPEDPTAKGPRAKLGMKEEPERGSRAVITTTEGAQKFKASLETVKDELDADHAYAWKTSEDRKKESRKSNGNQNNQNNSNNKAPQSKLD